MMAAYGISSVGLLLDMIGIVLIWRYGFQADLTLRGQNILLDTRPTDPTAPGFGVLALVCLLVGFGLQLVANIMQMYLLP
jgi:hypothetical protein